MASLLVQQLLKSFVLGTNIKQAKPCCVQVLKRQRPRKLKDPEAILYQEYISHCIL